MSATDLERWDALPGVAVARTILRDAFGLELFLADAAGPLAHQRGGVVTTSTEACRASLFRPQGFARCDAFYRELGAASGERTAACHLGLVAVSAPVSIGDRVLAQVVASGFLADAVEGRAVDRPALARALAELDPSLPDPASPARAARHVRGDRVDLVRAVVRATAAEIVEHELARDRRLGPASSASSPGPFGLVGASPRMREVFDILPRLAASHATALVLGESGTGKELVARALHDHGPRVAGPFVAQSCAAVPEDLLESTLFGHVRGAFSGADRASDGLFAAADGGTLFLDEVGDMPPSLQVKLLRVLQDRTYMPVGATAARSVDVRVIAATHRDLEAMVRTGALRQDLFYRLNVLPVRLPPLRDRPGDVRLLVGHFLDALEGGAARVSEAAWRCLERYRWPGNVRELRAEVERWRVTAPGARELGPEHLSAPIRAAGGYAGTDAGGAAAAAAAGDGTLAEAVEALERALIERGLERTGGNRTQLARDLDISRTTLGQRLRKYGLE